LGIQPNWDDVTPYVVAFQNRFKYSTHFADESTEQLITQLQAQAKIGKKKTSNIVAPISHLDLREVTLETIKFPPGHIHADEVEGSLVWFFRAN